MHHFGSWSPTSTGDCFINLLQRGFTIPYTLRVSWSPWELWGALQCSQREGLCTYTHTYAPHFGLFSYWCGQLHKAPMQKGLHNGHSGFDTKGIWGVFTHTYAHSSLKSCKYGELLYKASREFAKPPLYRASWSLTLMGADRGQFGTKLLFLGIAYKVQNHTEKSCSSNFYHIRAEVKLKIFLARNWNEYPDLHKKSRLPPPPMG